MDIEEFRRHGHSFVDWMADYLATVEERPVRAQSAPGAIAAALPAAAPEQGEAMEAIFADFREIILPAMTHWQHPNFFAYFPANSSPPSVLAEMLTATMGAQCMLWQTSPAASELEGLMMDWLRQMIGLPDDFAGVIQDSASSATRCSPRRHQSSSKIHASSRINAPVGFRSHATGSCLSCSLGTPPVTRTGPRPLMVIDSTSPSLRPRE